jgi:secondary thiamine-phosphate synthase enzyme
MRQAIHRISVTTKGRGLTEITREVARFVEGAGIVAGLATAFCRHTSASLIIQENADPDVQTDLEAFFAAIAPEAPGRYVHGAEGPDDMPAHIRAALTANHLSIPVAEGRPDLGMWQGVFVFEHRAQPHERRITLHLSGD